jgi:methionyl-tRNA synthetase
MRNQHTKEPWSLGKERPQPNTHVVLISVNDTTAVATGNPEDARRIVACVNRCAGMSTEFLEQDVDLFTPKNLLIEQNERYKKLNSDLLMGLRQMMDDCRMHERLAKTVLFAQKILNDAENLS